MEILDLKNIITDKNVSNWLNSRIGRTEERLVNWKSEKQILCNLKKEKSKLGLGNLWKYAMCLESKKKKDTRSELENEEK